jgi:hypothetical protein
MCKNLLGFKTALKFGILGILIQGVVVGAGKSARTKLGP